MNDLQDHFFRCLGSLLYVLLNLTKFDNLRKVKENYFKTYLLFLFGEEKNIIFFQFKLKIRLLLYFFAD